jgi:hypothetical protein
VGLDQPGAPRVPARDGDCDVNIAQSSEFPGELLRREKSASAETECRGSSTELTPADRYAATFAPSREWMTRARCRGHIHPEWWFPKSSGRRAIDVCRHCPVLASCAGYSLAVGQTHGVVAGVKLRGLYYLDDDRARLLAVARRDAKPDPRQHERGLPTRSCPPHGTSAS